MKIALVKQDVYQDLYVGNKKMYPEELLYSSSGRVGPISLFDEYDCDYYIVEEENTSECHVWEKIMPKMVKEFRKLKTQTVKAVKGMEFHEPGSDKPNGYYAVKCSSIDWSKYDAVISINVSVPTKIVQKYPQVLWAYMIGEANFMLDKVYFGYDVCLNQLIRGENDLAHGVIDFPYTFVNKDHLERILHDKLGEVEKSGIYGEINTTTERPVKSIPQFEPISKATGEPILLHKQNIKNNLIEMYKAKYYLKVGGRQTRGNGAIEAISLGTVVLLSPSDIICGQVLPKEAWVFNSEDAIEKINYLNSHPEEYEKLLELERALVQQFVIDYPKFWLEKAVELKKKIGVNKVYKYSNAKYFLDIVKRYRNKKKRIQLIGK